MKRSVKLCKSPLKKDLESASDVPVPLLAEPLNIAPGFYPRFKTAGNGPYLQYVYMARFTAQPRGPELFFAYLL